MSKKLKLKYSAELSNPSRDRKYKLNEDNFKFAFYTGNLAISVIFFVRPRKDKQMKCTKYTKLDRGIIKRRHKQLNA